MALLSVDPLLIMYAWRSPAHTYQRCMCKGVTKRTLHFPNPAAVEGQIKVRDTGAVTHRLKSHLLWFGLAH